ncbi:MAG TPA: L,D-transpeptidase family protein [Bacteroidia bacterium]|jgi:murein L,D-transpeptidase YafK|nr:L,D-transpeptidase family protein [Bacteroidia bacterium]
MVINIRLLKNLLLFLSFGSSLMAQPAFLKQQLKYPKVKASYNEKWAAISKNLKAKGIDSANYKVLIRLFKEEKVLEVWLKSKNTDKYINYGNYDICRSSGSVGPKRQEGDLQVPEGFYKVNFFNAFSDYYLGMQINYPNQSDLALGKRPYGGQIMIHGNCVTIGCIPITDDKIKEVYLLCLFSKGAGYDVAVDSYPFKLETKKLDDAKKSYDKTLVDFWMNLKPFYDYFEQKHLVPVIGVDRSGLYKML